MGFRLKQLDQCRGAGGMVRWPRPVLVTFIASSEVTSDGLEGRTHAGHHNCH